MASPDLGQICVQVHPGRAPELDLGRLVAACETLARCIKGCRGFGRSQGEDEGAYVNLVFAMERPADSWPQLRDVLLESTEFGSALKQSCMCLCMGANGWSDYLLLYHFDPAEPVDKLLGASKGV